MTLTATHRFHYGKWARKCIEIVRLLSFRLKGEISTIILRFLTFVRNDNLRKTHESIDFHPSSQTLYLPKSGLLFSQLCHRHHPERR